MHDADSSSPDIDIPAAYAFFGQFIDHDVTLDIKSQLHGEPLSNKDIADLPNIRTASLDLDCVYGFGPEASPHLYAGGTAGRLVTGNSGNQDDLARSESGVALIGDPRNDENIFVSQLQLLWIRFHNKLLDHNIGKYPASSRFEETQREVRYHYQYLVLHDFLGRICDKEVFKFAYKELKKRGAQFPLSASSSNDDFAMPVEFSAAAYRFGHSLVRSVYAVNGAHPDVDLFDERFGTNGFSHVPEDLVVDWSLTLDVDPCVKPLMCKSIDEKLADELIQLPNPIVGRSAPEDDRSLAFRNILRGNSLSLACGQLIAEALQKAGYPVDPNVDLKLGPVLNDCRLERFVDETPLFFYILRESNIVNGGKRLGPVGSAILMEVFGAMLAPQCNETIFSEENWKPQPCIKGPGNSKFTLADIVRFVEK